MIQMKYAIILGADSYIAHAKCFAHALNQGSPNIHYFILKNNGNPTISDRQLDRFFAGKSPSYEYLQDETFFSKEFIEKFDGIFLGVPGTAVYRFTKWKNSLKLSQDATSPITVTAFPGVQYDIQTYGQWTRRHADVLLFNDRRTFKNYKFTAKTLFRTGTHNALLFGYPFEKLPEETRKNTVFIDQHAMPQSYEDRKYLVQKLVEYAALTPDRKMIILGRSKPDEISNHSPRRNSHIEHLLNEVMQEHGAQDNIELSYAPASDILPTASLCIGINSTLLIQTIWTGIPTVALKTRGTAGPFDAYRLFQKSRFALFFDDMIQGNMPHAPSAHWLQENMLVCSEKTQQNLRHKMEELSTPTRSNPQHKDWMAQHSKDRIKKLCGVWDKILHAFIRG